MVKKLMGLIVLTSIAISNSIFAEELVRTDRYTLTTAEAQGDQKEPLTTVVTLSLSADVRTLGEAITELLNGSGYRWELHTDDPLLNVLPLPSIVRTLGPIRVDDALSTIAGKAWILRVDEFRRVIWFDVNHTVTSTSN